MVFLAFSTPVWAWPTLPFLELERTVIYVDAGAADSLDADGYCSLREAIRNANANSQVDHADCEAGVNSLDTISLPADTYTLSMAGRDEDEGATGDLDITESVTISADYYVIDANLIDRIFEVVSADATLTLEGLYLYHGIANEGGHACPVP